jgi:hypothetical protein
MSVTDYQNQTVSMFKHEKSSPVESDAVTSRENGSFCQVPRHRVAWYDAIAQFHA